jgi:hypothetical protein
MLARSEPATDLESASSRYALASGWAAFFSMLLMALFLGVRADLAQAAVDPMLWIKISFSAVLLAGGLIASLRLARPGASSGRVGWLIAAPLLVIWGLAVVELIGADPARRVALALGQTWASCPLLVAGLSLPGMVAFTWAMKGLAPTRLRLAGGATGLVSGALGATVYCLHCPESAAPFIGVWYVIGILIPTLIGALIGPRVLRW